MASRIGQADQLKNPPKKATPRKPTVKTDVKRPIEGDARSTKTRQAANKLTNKGAPSRSLPDSNGLTLRASGQLTTVEELVKDALEKVEDGLTKTELTEILKSFNTVADPKAALRKIGEKAPGLAHTLLIYGDTINGQKGLERDDTIQIALAHYTINTEGTLRKQRLPAFQAQRLLNSYARELGLDGVIRDGNRLYGYVGDAKVDMGSMPKKKVPLETIRQLGRSLNRQIFGADKTIAPRRVDTDLSTKNSPKNKLVSSQLAGLAYQEPDVVAAVARSMGFTTFTPVEDEASDTHAFVLGNKENAICLFRGTSSFKNFVTDLKFSKVPLEEGSKALVHSGFKHVSDVIQSRLTTALDGRDAVFIGHSLGAALARLAAFEYQRGDEGGRVARRYPIGSPNVGNLQFKETDRKALGARTTNQVNNRDLIARIPPKLFGYSSNAGETEVYDRDGNVRTLEAGEELSSVKPDEKVLLAAKKALEHASGRKGDVEHLATDGEVDRKGGDELELEVSLEAVNDHSVAHYQEKALALLLKKMLHK